MKKKIKITIPEGGQALVKYEGSLVEDENIYIPEEIYAYFWIEEDEKRNNPNKFDRTVFYFIKQRIKKEVEIQLAAKYGDLDKNGNFVLPKLKDFKLDSINNLNYKISFIEGE